MVKVEIEGMGKMVPIKPIYPISEFGKGELDILN
jgi:hypothetical protein